MIYRREVPREVPREARLLLRSINYLLVTSVLKRSTQTIKRLNDVVAAVDYNEGLHSFVVRIPRILAAKTARA